MLKCISCKTEINPLRLKALPNTKVCVKCSTTEQVGCVDITYHKTGNTIQVMDKESLLLFLYFGIIPITIFTIIGFLSNNKILIQISIYGMLLTQIFNSLGTFMQQRNFIS